MMVSRAIMRDLRRVGGTAVLNDPSPGTRDRRSCRRSQFLRGRGLAVPREPRATLSSLPRGPLYRRTNHRPEPRLPRVVRNRRIRRISPTTPTTTHRTELSMSRSSLAAGEQTSIARSTPSYDLQLDDRRVSLATPPERLRLFVEEGVDDARCHREQGSHGVQVFAFGRGHSPVGEGRDHHRVHEVVVRTEHLLAGQPPVRGGDPQRFVTRPAGRGLPAGLPSLTRTRSHRRVWGIVTSVRNLWTPHVARLAPRWSDPSCGQPYCVRQSTPSTNEGTRPS